MINNILILIFNFLLMMIFKNLTFKFIGNGTIQNYNNRQKIGHSHFPNGKN
jgi:hypothetical protein